MLQGVHWLLQVMLLQVWQCGQDFVPGTLVYIKRKVFSKMSWPPKIDFGINHRKR